MLLGLRLLSDFSVSWRVHILPPFLASWHRAVHPRVRAQLYRQPRLSDLNWAVLRCPESSRSQKLSRRRFAEVVRGYGISAEVLDEYMSCVQAPGRLSSIPLNVAFVALAPGAACRVQQPSARSCQG